jgi:hypothetical protein
VPSSLFVCHWCQQPFQASRADARYCGSNHRVAALRNRRKRAAETLAALQRAESSLGRIASPAARATVATKRTAPLSPTAP